MVAKEQQAIYIEKANASFLDALKNSIVSLQTDRSEAVNGICRPETLFNLYHTFAHAFPTLLEKYKKYSNQEKLEYIRQDLVELLSYQLQSFLSEVLETPLSTTAMHLEVSPSGLKAQDPRYQHGDVIRQSELAIMHAEAKGYSANARRYELELEQWKALFPIFPHAVLLALQESEIEPEEQIPEDWVMCSQDLPADLLKRYSLSKGAKAYVGPQAFTIFPQNHDVYQEGLAYWCMYSVVYIPTLPKGKQFHLILNQYFNPFRYIDHADALHKVQASDPQVKLSQSPTEQEIMQYIAVPDAQFKTLDPSLIVAELTKRMGRESIIHEVMVKQQQTIAEFQRRAGYILPAADYLTTVFLHEFNRFARGQSSVDEIAAILQFAGEIPLNTLIRGDIFEEQTALSRYFSAFNPYNRKFSSDIQGRKKEFKEQRNKFIESFKNTNMSGVLEKAASIFDCAQGTFGGLIDSETLSRFNSSQELSAFFRSDLVKTEDLIPFIGERAKNFKPGICGKELRKKGYKVGCGSRTLIGECGLCYGCESAAIFDKYANFGSQDKIFPKINNFDENVDVDDANSREYRGVSISSAVFSVFAPNILQA